MTTTSRDQMSVCRHCDLGLHLLRKELAAEMVDGTGLSLDSGTGPTSAPLDSKAPGAWLLRGAESGSSSLASPASQILSASCTSAGAQSIPLTSHLLAGAGSEGQRGSAVWASTKEGPSSARALRRPCMCILVLHLWLQAVSQAGLPLHAGCPSSLQPGQMLLNKGWQGCRES